jgi:nuclear cap-binding protein subunit 1
VVIDRIHQQAIEHNLPDPLCPSTDAYVTAMCYIGSKSLSHILTYITRCKDRLIAFGSASPAARQQIIESVMTYWKDQPGIGVNIVDKLLNYTILSPQSVIEWALANNSSRLSRAYVYELVAATITKVTGRFRQVVAARHASNLSAEQKQALQEPAEQERKSMKELFVVMEDLLVSWASGSKDQVMEDGDGTSEEEKAVRQWGERWLRTFRRKIAVEDAWFLEVEKIAGAIEGNGAVTMED